MSEEKSECWSGYEQRRPSAEIDRIHSEIAEIRKSQSEMSESIKLHIAKSDDIAPALQELVSLWRASKIIGLIFTGIAGAVASLWGAYLWAREHINVKL